MKKIIFSIFVIHVALYSSILKSQNNVTFNYDSTNRITQINYINCKSIIYAYDELGNRTSEVVSTLTLPQISQNNIAVCAGSNALLSASSNNGTIVWFIDSLGTTPLATGNAYFANNLFQDTVFYVATTNGTCTTNHFPIHIIINPLPANAETISGLTTLCQGQNSVIYTVPTITNATSYTWTLPSGAVGTSTTNSIVVNYVISAASGDISVKGVNACGDGIISTLPITVNAKPETPIITLTGNNVLKSDATIGNQWYNQSGIINGAANQNYPATSNGDYYVVVTTNDCSSESSNTIHITNTGISVNETNKSITVYPNPVLNELTIEMKGNTNPVIFEILNSLGQVVFKGDLLQKTTVQTSTFTPGVYLIKLENGQLLEFKKIIKE